MGEYCGGCSYHRFPYKAYLPYLINGKREERTFENIEDVWNVVDELIIQTEDLNEEKGKEIDLTRSVNAQLPFFTCRSHFFDYKIQKDINRYVYCKDLGIAPYKGTYGEQPARWVDVFFLIKNAFAKKEQSLIEKQQQKTKGKTSGS